MTRNPPTWLRRLPEAALSHWRHGWSTIKGPDFISDPTSDEHSAAVKQLVAAAGLDGGAWARQVHGGTVLLADKPGFLGEADAVWSTKPGLGVIGRSADCPLILLSGTDAAGHGLWAFAHASWRSTVAEITTKVLRNMITAGLRPDQTRAIICPSAGPCCYEVGPEVREQAIAQLGAGAARYFPMLGIRPAFDLWLANCGQIEALGIPAANITVTGECTICGGKNYPSHRREQGQAGRFAAISGGY